MNNDIINNRHNNKGLLFIIIFRISHFFSKSIFLRIIGFPIRFFYLITIRWILGIDIPDQTKIGKGFMVYHGQGIVVHRDTIIGENVKIRQNTTIGNKKSNGLSPIIGNNVNIGANSVIIGDIKIGNNVIIAAGSVVINNIIDYSVAAGNPAKIKRSTNNEE